jgi:hypothetical protein
MFTSDSRTSSEAIKLIASIQQAPTEAKLNVLKRLCSNEQLEVFEHTLEQLMDDLDLDGPILSKIEEDQSQLSDVSTPHKNFRQKTMQQRPSDYLEMNLVENMISLSEHSEEEKLIKHKSPPTGQIKSSKTLNLINLKKSENMAAKP